MTIAAHDGPARARRRTSRCPPAPGPRSTAPTSTARASRRRASARSARAATRGPAWELVARLARALGYALDWKKLADVHRAMAPEAYASAFTDGAPRPGERGGRRQDRDKPEAIGMSLVEIVLAVVKILSSCWVLPQHGGRRHLGRPPAERDGAGPRRPEPRRRSTCRATSSRVHRAAPADGPRRARAAARRCPSSRRTRRSGLPTRSRCSRSPRSSRSSSAGSSLARPRGRRAPQRRRSTRSRLRSPASIPRIDLLRRRRARTRSASPSTRLVPADGVVAAARVASVLLAARPLRRAASTRPRACPTARSRSASRACSTPSPTPSS